VNPLLLTQLTRESLPQASNPPLLLLLHGVGSNEHDLFGLAPLLDQRFVVVSLCAPITLGPGNYAWFEVAFTPQGSVINPEQG
jgi:phospholipase/carboxylesterase